MKSCGFCRVCGGIKRLHELEEREKNILHFIWNQECCTFSCDIHMICSTCSSNLMINHYKNYRYRNKGGYKKKGHEIAVWDDIKNYPVMNSLGKPIKLRLTKKGKNWIIMVVGNDLPDGRDLLGKFRKPNAETPPHEIPYYGPLSLEKILNQQTPEMACARNVLDKAADMFSVNPRMEAAVAAIAAETLKPTPEPVSVEISKTATPTNSALKGISSSLLEKIRAREAAKTARDMTRTKSDNKELEMLSRLPEIARIIRTVFITEKKAALPWEMVTSKVSSTYTGLLLPKEHASHLNMLIKEVPGWATICKVQRRIYLKINRNTELSEIYTKLQAVIKAKR